MLENIELVNLVKILSIVSKIVVVYRSQEKNYLRFWNIQFGDQLNVISTDRVVREWSTCGKPHELFEFVLAVFDNKFNLNFNLRDVNIFITAAIFIVFIYLAEFLWQMLKWIVDSSFNMFCCYFVTHSVTNNLKLITRQSHIWAKIHRVWLISWWKWIS